MTVFLDGLMSPLKQPSVGSGVADFQSPGCCACPGQGARGAFGAMRLEGTHGRLFVPYDKPGLPNMLQAWLNISEHVENVLVRPSIRTMARLIQHCLQRGMTRPAGMVSTSEHGESALWLYPPFARKTLAHDFGKVTSSAPCICHRCQADGFA